MKGSVNPSLKLFLFFPVGFIVGRRGFGEIGASNQRVSLHKILSALEEVDIRLPLEGAGTPSGVTEGVVWGS